MMLIYGVIYAWSIYSTPFSEIFGWTSAQLGVCFSIMLATFCVGGAIGGAVASRLGIRTSIPIGSIISSGGFFLCTFLKQDTLWLLYISYAIAGIGVGFVYNNVLAAVVPRFPEKKGTASGIMLMGYGASSLVLGSIVGKLISTPGISWQLIYILTGALMLAAGFIGPLFITPPKREDDGSEETLEGLTTKEALRTSRFWLFFLIAMIGTGFGSGIIAHARYVVLESGAIASLATLSVGLISVMNGFGRVIFGILHDRFGFRLSLLLHVSLYIFGGIVTIFALRSGIEVLLIIALMTIGLGYGAISPLTSAVSDSFFGPAHYGQNLGALNLFALPAAVASTISGIIQTSSGSYVGAVMLLLAIELIALVLILVLNKTCKIYKAQSLQ